MARRSTASVRVRITFLGYEFGKRFGDSDGVLHNVSFPLEAARKAGLGAFRDSLWGEVYGSGLTILLVLQPRQPQNRAPAPLTSEIW